MEYSRHQSTKASKPPSQKYLRLVEVPHTESAVVEGVCAVLLPVVVVRVVEGPEIRLLGRSTTLGIRRRRMLGRIPPLRSSEGLAVECMRVLVRVVVPRAGVPGLPGRD